MVNVEYSEAATEVLAILDNTRIEDVNKIPQKFIEFLKDNSSKTYKPNLDYTKSISGLDLKAKTRALLGLIYIKYWANENEKNEFDQKIKLNEEKYREKLRDEYSSNNLFENKEKNIEEKYTQEEIKSLTVQNKNFIQKIIEIMQRIFRR